MIRRLAARLRAVNLARVAWWLVVIAVGVGIALAWRELGLPLWVLTVTALALLLASWVLWVSFSQLTVCETAEAAADDADRTARATDELRAEHNVLRARFEALCAHLEVNTDNASAEQDPKQEVAHVPDQAAPQRDVGARPIEISDNDDHVRVGQYRVPKEPLTFPDEPVQPIRLPPVVADRAQQWDDDAEVIAFRQRLDAEEVAFRKRLAALAAGTAEGEL